MVFESVVVELLNRFLGQFIENLDTSQLKIGLWGGDVVLKDLQLKENALDELDLGVKVKAGHLGKLTLRIPWKKLYTAPVVVEIDGIYALAVPASGLKYDAEKEKKTALEDKLAKLKKIEEQKAAEKADQNKDGGDDAAQDSFVEKMASQIIKNLQIKVSKIHIRYEDKTTNPKRPVAIGVTLKELLFHTTDENWAETVIKENIRLIYKLVRLDSLSVYWNSLAVQIQDRDKYSVLKFLADTIPKQDFTPNFQYIFRPISAVAHLKLNTKPELEHFQVPKAFLTLVFDEIAINLSKSQYDDILELLQSIERMQLLAKYRKTRPDVPYHGNAKQWWQHAYQCIYEHTVKRRRTNWNWEHMQWHRQKMKEYRAIYTRKLEGKTLNSKEKTTLEDIENKLDVLHIVLARNAAEVQAKRIAQTKVEEKQKKAEAGWFGGWFGGKKEGETKVEAQKTGVLDELAQDFDLNEKAKLYSAIGYDEKDKPKTLPKEFVAVRLIAKLNKITLGLVDTEKIRANVNGQLLKVSLTDIVASVKQRPGADAIRVDTKVEKFKITGTPQGSYLPKLVNSVTLAKQKDNALLTFSLETNPLEGDFDTAIHAVSRPLEIIYDAVTVNDMGVFFSPPESVRLHTLSEAAMAKYNVIKTQTATGMLHALDDRKYTDMEIHLMPSYIIIPATGRLQKNVDMLLLNLGTFKVVSEKNRSLKEKLKLFKEKVDWLSVIKEGKKKGKGKKGSKWQNVKKASQLTKEQLQELAYDKFNISLENVQLLFVQPGDSWHDPNRSTNSPLYILRPLSLSIAAEKCLFKKDPSLPAMRMSGELPLIFLAMSDSKLLSILKLVASIPVPDPVEENSENFDTIDNLRGEEAMGLLSDIDMDLNNAIRIRHRKPQAESEYINFINLQATFVISRVVLEMMETKDTIEVPFLKLTLSRIGFSMKQRSFDLALDAYLGGIYLQHLQYKVSRSIQEQLAKFEVLTGELINIINTPCELEDEPLLAVNFLQADKNGPEFHTTYNSTAQSVTVQFSTLDLVLHQGTILSLISFVRKIIPESDTPAPPPPGPEMKTKSTMSLDFAKSRTNQPEIQDIMAFKVRALVDSLQLGICNESSLFMHTKIEGLEFGSTMQKDKMGVTALLRRIELSDPDPLTLHPKILHIHSSEVLRFDMMMYHKGTKGARFEDVNNVDMEVNLTMGRARIVFVNKFVISLLNFLDNFGAAKEKLAEGQKAAQEGAIAVAAHLKENTPRIKLNILVKAPLVVIPQNSRSLDSLLVNLGDIQIKSKFERLQPRVKDRTLGPLIVDKMTIIMSNICLSRGIIFSDVDKGVQAEIVIIEPISFMLNVIRNTTPLWSQHIPDLELQAVLKMIIIHLSQEDISLSFKLLSENLTEIDPNGPLPASRLEEPLGLTSKPHPNRVPEASQGLTTIPEDDAEKHQQLIVDFSLKSIQIKLYYGNCELTSGTRHHDKTKMLANLQFEHMGLGVILYSNSSIKANVFLEDVLLDDKRRDKQGGITKMIRRAAFKDQEGPARESEDSSIKVIDVDFSQATNSDKSVVLHICSLHICVCLEFLMKIADFFISAMPPPKQQTISQAELKAKHKADRKTRSKSVSAEPESSGCLSVVLKLDKPEIYFIEDADNLLTNSLILDVSVDFRLKMTPTVLSVNGSISNLSLVSCIFNKPETYKQVQKKPRRISKMEKALLEIFYHYYTGSSVELTKQNMTPSLIYVLSPCDITMIASAPNKTDHHVNIDISDLVLNVSPATIRLLSTIAAGLAKSSTDQENTELPEFKTDKLDTLWLPSDLSKMTFWFTNAVDYPDMDPEDSTFTGPKTLLPEVTGRGEQLIISAPVIVLKVEGGVGNRTVPLVTIESHFSGQVINWSTKLFVEGNLGVEMAYFNERLGVWEPILEPVYDGAKEEFSKWELALDINSNDEALAQEADDAVILPQPKMCINVMAYDSLQLLVTKTCLSVLSNLGEAFTDAYNLSDQDGGIVPKLAPFVFKNLTGETLDLHLDSCFVPFEFNTGETLTELMTGQEWQMNIVAKVSAKPSVMKAHQYSLIKGSDTDNQEGSFSFTIHGHSGTQDMTIRKAASRKYTFGEQVVVVTCDPRLGQKVVTFTSVLQIHNHLPSPITVLYQPDSSSPDMKPCGLVEPHELFHVPLGVIYRSTGKVAFEPLEGGEPCEPFSWENMTREKLGSGSKLKRMTNKNSNPGQLDTVFNVYPESTSIHEGSAPEMTGEMLTLNLHPPVYLHNLLPIPVSYILEGMEEPVRIEAGNYIPLMSATPDATSMEILFEYSNYQWSGRRQIKTDVPVLSVWSFQGHVYGGRSKEMKVFDLGFHTLQRPASLDVSVYCPYWLVNLSSHNISLRENDKHEEVTVEAGQADIVMFTFPDKSGKACCDCNCRCCNRSDANRKAQLQVKDSDWSNKFSLDTVGGSGSVACKHSGGYNMEVGLKISLSSSGLTKIVTFTPFYLLVNAGTMTICVIESAFEMEDMWTNIHPQQCLAFYPRTSSKVKEITMIVRVNMDESMTNTQPFVINKAHTTLLSLTNEYGGVYVDCQVRENAMITTFKNYQHGMATTLFVNHTTKRTVAIRQSGKKDSDRKLIVDNTLTIEPYTAQLYTWQNPTGKREILWTCGSKLVDVKNKLEEDKLEEHIVDAGAKLYVVSFLDGRQRVVMFTENLPLATLAMEAGELEQADMELNLHIADIGLTLLNNEDLVELAYMGITSSGVIWQEEKKGRFKAMKVATSVELEKVYQIYLAHICAGNTDSTKARAALTDIDIDFESMQMSKPRMAKVRRSFEDGVWLQYRQSPHSTQVHAKVNRLQFDNQMRTAIFPVIFSPMPLPKSVVWDSSPKPFVEVSLMMRVHEHSELTQVKYFKVLIQEMSVQVDKGFINAVLRLLPASAKENRNVEISQFNLDIEKTKKKLKDLAGVSIQEAKTTYFDYFHVAPIKIHLNWSIIGDTASTDAVGTNAVTVLLNSIVSFVDIQDAVFKLGYFERTNKMLDTPALMQELGKHFVSQFLKQWYVIILGFDMIGNPFALARGLTVGVEDLFYEPYQGAVQGPGEFAQGMAYGVSSMFGATVGGAAGAASKITGTLGKGLASLTFDDDYQKKRMERMYRKPASASEGFAQAGKGLAMGVFDGVTGIVRKPIEGASKEGAKGFFKGLGKGVVGMVTRPVGGGVDFISSSLQGVKRITEFTEDVERLRPPRRLYQDRIIRPYFLLEAVGFNLLVETDKGRFSTTDDYLGHANIRQDGKLVFLATDTHLMEVKREKVFGSWASNWVYALKELAHSPMLKSYGMQLTLKVEKKKFFGSNIQTVDVELADPTQAKLLVANIRKAMHRMPAEVSDTPSSAGSA